MVKILKYVLIDLFKNRIIIAYAVFLFILSVSIFNLSGDSSKGILSLLNVVLLFLPLVSIIFSAIYFYNSAEFTELLLTQPMKRTTILLSQFTGLCISLMAAVLAGIGIPVLLFDTSAAGLWLLFISLFLTIIFAAIATCTVIKIRDKAKGIGTSILLWFYFSLIYDGLVLFFLFSFTDYPLEKPMIIISLLNPIDLARIAILLKLDTAALMGYTGAVFKEFFDTTAGVAVIIIALLLWGILPICRAIAIFKRKDI